ncbi:MAG TPA: CHAT domain-containing protein [Thermoanaerobaculia bacterium]|nr:CHAT domain-containing protein [Thermoanaerobaculia bacterium]
MLNAIPTRWESLPAPVVPVSGRSIEEVLGPDSEAQRKEASRWLARLLPLEARPALIQAKIRERRPTEVDLWLPVRLAQSQQKESLDEAAATLEAWLQWAEALGRKDALLLAASLSIDTLRLHRGAPAVLSVTRAWAALPSTPRTERSQAALKISLATVLFGIGENQDARAAYRNARQLFLAAGDPLGQGVAWRGEADVLFRLGENQEALDAYRRARALFDQTGVKLGQGSALRGEADVLFRLGKNQKALEAYRGARALFQNDGSKLGQGNTWRGEADVRFRLGENEKALAAYRSARELFLAVGFQLGQGEAWQGEANVLVLLGETQQALDAYQKARELFLAVGSPLGQGDAWRGEADVLFRLGENEKALTAYGKARELFVTVGDKFKEGNTWKGEADIFSYLAQNQKALEAYRRARELYVAVGDPLGQGNTWRGEADILLRLGEHQKSLEASRNARRYFLAVGDRIGQGNSWLGEARALRESLAWKLVAQAAAAAISHFQSAGDVPNQIPAFLLEAEAEGRTGDATAAARSASKAIRLHSQWRQTWITDRLRTEQEETISRAYDLLVPLRARQPGEAAEALRLAEEARSRVLLDLLAAGPSRGSSGPAPSLPAEVQRLQTEMWQIEDQTHSSPGQNQQTELGTRRHELDQELEWSRYRRIAAQDKSLATAPPLDAAAIRALAHETGPLLLYYSAEREVWGFLVLPETSEIVVRPMVISWRELGQEARSLARDLANPLYEPRAGDRARKLYDLLIAPFADRIPAGGPLVLVPHGPLHELPFEALLDPAGKRLFERWRISVTPSASALNFARRGHAVPSPDDFFLAFSSGAGLNRPVEEIREISGFFSTNRAILSPAEATYQSYEKLVTRARHLLIATRGVHTEGSRTETYLELQPAPEIHDSRLTAAEIATIPLQAELVTLAACDTSTGQALLSDERLDLTRSFLIARAVAVLATRWKVPEDAATSHFLADFYRAYRRGGPQGTGLRKDEALTEARRLSRERGDPAQVWAAWVLVGDAR